MVGMFEIYINMFCNIDRSSISCDTDNVHMVTKMLIFICLPCKSGNPISRSRKFDRRRSYRKKPASIVRIISQCNILFFSKHGDRQTRRIVCPNMCYISFWWALILLYCNFLLLLLFFLLLSIRMRVHFFLFIGPPVLLAENELMIITGYRENQ